MIHKQFSKEEEKELHKEFMAGSIDARDKLVLSQTGFITKICRSFTKKSKFDINDAIAESQLFIINKLHKFDPERGRLITFVGNIIPQVLRNKYSQYNALTYYPAISRFPEKAKKFRTVASINIESEEFGKEYDLDIAIDYKDIFKLLPEYLNNNEIFCMREIFMRNQTLASVGNKMNISKERVRQIRNSALIKIRENLGEIYEQADKNQSGNKD